MKRKYKIERPYTHLGEFLTKRRQRVNLTQRQVSLELGYSSAQFISNFERGISAPPLKKMRQLIKLYRMRTPTIIKLMTVAEHIRITKGLSA